MLTNERIVIYDNWFTVPTGRTDLMKAPEDFPPPVNKVVVNDFSLIFHMYGGRDLESSPPSQTTKKKQGDLDAQRAPKRQFHSLGWRAQGGRGRDLEALLEFQFNKVGILVDIH